MFWEEKIDSLANKYKQGDFNVPFTIATSILKKIEDQFIIKHTSEKNLNDWPNHIKFKTFIKSIQINHLHSEFNKLGFC